jgi:hypothetical protein
MTCGQVYKTPVFFLIEGNKQVGKIRRRKPDIAQAVFVGVWDKPYDRRNSN